MAEIFQTIKKRWYVIIICAILGALTIFLEKQYINPLYLKKGTLTWSRQIQISPVPVENVGVTSKEIQFDKLAYVMTNNVKLLNQLDSNLDMSKVNAQWNLLSNHEKYKWLRKHFSIEYLSPGVYELVFSIQDFEARDNQYFQDNSLIIMNTYNDYISSIVRKYNRKANVNIINDVKIEDFKNVMKKQATTKYILIGMCLGGVIGLILVTLTGIHNSISEK